MEFKNLRQAVIAKNATKKAEYIQRLYVLEDGKEYIQENMITQYLSVLMIKRYKAGTLSLDDAQSKAKKAIILDYDKRLARELSKIEAVEIAEFPYTINISVEWKRSSLYGMNPTASVTSKCVPHFDYGKGTASGCGYDKESSAIAAALNSCPSVLKILYTAIEEDPSQKKQILGYGSGYSILPYFEGGVGISCFENIFEKCGYKWERVASGKTFDAYTINKGIK